MRERVAQRDAQPREGADTGYTLTLPPLRDGSLPLPRCGRGARPRGHASYHRDMLPLEELLGELLLGELSFSELPVEEFVLGELVELVPAELLSSELPVEELLLPCRFE